MLALLLATVNCLKTKSNENTAALDVLAELIDDDEVFAELLGMAKGELTELKATQKVPSKGRVAAHAEDQEGDKEGSQFGYGARWTNWRK